MYYTQNKYKKLSMAKRSPISATAKLLCKVTTDGVFGRQFVKRFALCYRSVVCLSVMFMHCGQTVGRIKTKLGMQVGLGPGHIVLDRYPAALPQSGTAPICGPYLLWPNGCMDQDVTWYGARPRPRRLCVKWGSYPPSPKGGGAEPPPNLSAHVYCSQMAG